MTCEQLVELFDKWVVSSVDADLWMIILLAMTTGWLTPRGEGAVDVTVQRVVDGETKFLWMNRVFAKMCELQDGSESTWPPLTFRSWRPTDADKVRLVVLTFLESGGDYLPVFSGLPFDKMWVLVLKSVRTEGLFDKPFFFEDQDGTWAVDIDECAKLLATPFFYKDEAAFGSAHLTPRQLLESVRGGVEDYVSLIRYAILQLPKKKTTATCPPYFALRMQAARGNATFRYWQNGLRETMPATEFAGKGWGVDRRGQGSNGDELAAGNCVLWLSECKDRKCSLACGCRGHCTLRRAAPAPVRAGGMSASRPTVGASQTGPIEGVARHQPPVDTRPQPSVLVSNAMTLFAASMKQQESHGAEQNDEETGTTESPASNGDSSGQAADSENEELEGPESDENSDGSVGALDDLIKLDSDESGSSDGESDVLSEKSVDPAWSDGDTNDGIGDLVLDAWN
ncbi:unnamed protein product [Ectocarpus sp. CCAP 1310/34]|nr:unnamed protein product [Ectocarpus sp. CCAP 1310/34]